MEGNLQAWSWRDIHDIYRILGHQLKQYQGIAMRVNVDWNADMRFLDMKSGDVIEVKEAQEASFVAWWFRDVQRLDAQINCLDQEIERRNNLIGVMG